MARRRLRARVCLNMIAKDEANDRLVPALQAAAVHITGYMFCDTGSTDGTPELAKSIFDYFNLKGKVAHHSWKDFAHNRNYCLEDGKRLMGNKCDYWLLLDADQIMVAEEGFGLAELELKDSAYYLREVARDSEFTNRRIISTRFPWKYFGKVHEVILPADDSFAGKDTTGTLPKSIYSIHESDMGRGFDRDAVLLESSVQEDPTDKRSTFYLANTYNMLNRKEDAIVWWARQKPERDPEAEVNVSTEDLISILKVAHEIIPARQESLYTIAKLLRADKQDYAGCANYAEQARAAGWYNDTTLFANINIYKYGVLDELCVCSFYVPAKAEVGQQACKDLIKLLEGEGVTEDVGRQDLRNMLRLTRNNLNSHRAQALAHENNGGGIEEAAQLDI
ncbi:hypothetical protein KSW81_002290 [Nannochloris sp. 'desiccata']|nr:hypothetical protein KSW81_002290 [Chlorella desiccata (nom. nud.)]